MGINPKTGKKEYTETQLDMLKPKWRRQWKDYTDLDEDMVDYVVNKIHTGPFEYPGTRIAEGAGKGISIKMREVAHEWKQEKKKYTGSQLYREGRKRLNVMARKMADAKEIEDPFAFEYYLTAKQRKLRRNPYDVK